MKEERTIRIIIGAIIFVILVILETSLNLSNKDQAKKDKRKTFIRMIASAVVSAIIAYFSTALLDYTSIIDILFPPTTTVSTEIS